MATVYVVTAGSGESYRIERVYLDSDQAYRFAQDYNGIAPVEPVQVEEWQVGAPPSVYDGPYWRAEWWARMPMAKRRGELRHTDEGERFDDLRHPSGVVDRRRTAGGHGGAPGTDRGAEDRSGGVLQGEGGGTVLGDGHPGQSRVGGRTQEIAAASLCVERKETGMATRHCRPDAP